MPWFVKQERFLRPYAAMKPHLEAHRRWVEDLRADGVAIRSGYLVDAEGRPGGGGLLLLEAPDHASAEALVRRDPMVISGGVEWWLQRWVPLAATAQGSTSCSSFGLSMAKARPRWPSWAFWLWSISAKVRPASGTWNTGS